MARDKQATRADGPLGWQLWKHGDPESDGWEALLYSDTAIVGSPCIADDVVVGPFHMFPTGAERLPGDRPTGQLLVRVLHAEPLRVQGRVGTHAEHYQGMSPDEEIAALLSLVLDVRLRSAGLTRSFRHRDSDAHDPLGVPMLHDLHPPVLVPVPPRRRQLPQLDRETVPLAGALPFLERYPCLSPVVAASLARAARHYADALWVADADNEQAWLRLITALEVLAVHEHEETVSLIDVLRAMQKEGGEPISEEWAATVPPDIAEALVRTQRATAKFRAFVKRYRPEPPVERHAEPRRRVDWDRLDAAMSTVYGHRSALLHGGRRFPPGMVDLDLEPWDGPPAERVGGPISSFGTEWRAKDVPMHLWVAAYVTRGSILGWWTKQAARVPDM